LERQIHSFLFARLLKSKNKKGVLELAKKGQNIQAPVDTIKNPYVLNNWGQSKIIIGQIGWVSRQHNSQIFRYFSTSPLTGPIYLNQN